MGAGYVRVLSTPDLSDAVRLLNIRPLENVFVASRIRAGGLESFTLGCEVWGYEVRGELRAILHHGANLIPINADAAALDAFAEAIGPVRRCASIVGRSEAAMGLWRRLVRMYPAAWDRPREIRANQPLMAISGPAAGPRDPRVRRISMVDVESYFAAAVAMYTEEVGVTPLDGTNGYRWYVERLIDQGRAMGIVDGDGSVIFKSDVGSATATTCQVAGVWLRPDLRGHGLSAPAMASVVDLCREEWETVTLYVNDFNSRARALYRRVGFAEIGSLATVLY
jgi:GNAT superfamily N-acetyltransferase